MDCNNVARKECRGRYGKTGLALPLTGLKDLVGHALTAQAFTIPDLVLGLALHCPGEASLAPRKYEKKGGTSPAGQGKTCCVPDFRPFGSNRLLVARSP